MSNSVNLSAHPTVRGLGTFDLAVELISGQFVRPLAEHNKKDLHDAEVICEASIIASLYREKGALVSWLPHVSST